MFLKEQGAPLALCVMPVENNLPHHMHLISIVPADICAARHATFSMMDPPAPNWWPLHDRQCLLPRCINSNVQEEATVLRF